MSVRRQPTRLPLTCYRVTIKRHTCERWIVPARRVKLPAASATHAATIAVQESHSALGMPPWRPLVRLSLQHTNATRIGGELA